MEEIKESRENVIRLMEKRTVPYIYILACQLAVDELCAARLCSVKQMIRNGPTKPNKEDPADGCALNPGCLALSSICPLFCGSCEGVTDTPYHIHRVDNY